MKMPGSLRVVTVSSAETEQLGGALARLVPQGAVLALRGELASGKTCFVRGLTHALTGVGMVHSPTFTLVNEYGASPKVYHLDLYRLASLDELADLGYEELFDPDGICAVEWADRAGGLLPDQRVDVHFEHAGLDRRDIEITDRGVLPEHWTETLAADLPEASPR